MVNFEHMGHLKPYIRKFEYWILALVFVYLCWGGLSWFYPDVHSALTISMGNFGLRVQVVGAIYITFAGSMFLVYGWTGSARATVAWGMIPAIIMDIYIAVQSLFNPGVTPINGINAIFVFMFAMVCVALTARLEACKDYVTQSQTETPQDKGTS